jgi:hypothetical protein
VGGRASILRWSAVEARRPSAAAVNFGAGGVQVDPADNRRLPSNVALDYWAPQLLLTLALAETETLTLALAVTVAFAAAPTHAIAFPPRLADALTTALPVLKTLVPASFKSGPSVLAASQSLGRLASMAA